MFARVLTIALVMLLAGGCEKTNHENIDKWMKTEKGPAKLAKTLSDESIDPDLSAHAAANMIKKSMDPDVRQAFDQMSPPRRVAVIGKLAPRLWDIARVEGEMNMPAPVQVQAKDALFALRKYADAGEKQQIDNYLIDWYCVGSYEGRAHAGSVQGATVIRAIGPAAGKKLMKVLDQVIAAPGQEKAKNRIGDELMLGLAASGDPDAVKYVLDVAKMQRGDATLTERAMNALFRGYVDNQGEFDPADPAALAPHLDQIIAIAKDESTPPRAVDDAVSLIRAVGPPKCLPPLLGVIGMPHPNPKWKYKAAQQALRCGGSKAIVEVVRALPDVGYEHGDLQGAIAGEIADMQPRATVLDALHTLLGDKRTLNKWVAIESLAAMKATEDASKIAALSHSGEKLTGYWGTGDDAGKPEPTLGQRAKELEAQLGKGSK